MFHMRPAPGYADFRTPIAGLYQASSATHGGGGVTGIPGLSVVSRIVADQRLGRHLGRHTDRRTRARVPWRS
jgi:phytoene dehydrogenase-like protein